MVNMTTITKMQEMKLSTMAAAFQKQLEDPAFQTLSFEERVGLIIDQEWTTRKNNHMNRLMKGAGFSVPGACVENIEYVPERKLDKNLITSLSTCNYIREHHNVILLGPTGSGKTYIGCALGVSAVRNFMKVKYVRLPELLTELAIARASNTFPKVIQQYQKVTLLILDEWLLYPLKETETRDLLEIIESRYQRSSTIFCSQFDVPGWHDKFSSPLIADAICDRIAHDSYRILIESTESMRKRNGVKA